MGLSGQDDGEPAAIVSLRCASGLVDLRTGMSIGNGDRLQDPDNPPAHSLTFPAGRVRKGAVDCLDDISAECMLYDVPASPAKLAGYLAAMRNRIGVADGARLPVAVEGIDSMFAGRTTHGINQNGWVGNMPEDAHHHIRPHQDIADVPLEQRPVFGDPGNVSGQH